MREFFNFNILHGRHLCGMVIANFLPILQSKQLKISDDLIIITVSDPRCAANSTLNLVSLEDKEKLKCLIVPKYVFWISKVEQLYLYIKENYDKLPNYILYLDGSDTLILKDIVDPREYLDFYNCKVLFNIENQYAGTGYEAPNPTYLHDFYNTQYESFLIKNEEKYGNRLPYGLNAGVFLGEKEYVFKLVEEAYQYMSGSVDDGFPYGCSDDQYVFRYLHTKYHDIISADIFNVFSFWGGSMSVDNNPNNDMFRIGYTYKYLDDYLKVKENKLV
jgi:hypothetical protein